MRREGKVDKLIERKTELEAEREAFAEQANLRIAYLNGQIAEIDRLLDPEAEESGGRSEE
jgi:hypothetical protein